MYRRALSPYNSRVSNYLQALERDQTVSSLRREYARFRSIQAEYDDLKYEINKAQREKKRLQQKNCEVQDEYLQKIQQKKSLIQQLNDELTQLKQQISDTENKIDNKEKDNQRHISHIKDIKNQIECTEQSNIQLQKSVSNQQQIIDNLLEILNQLDIKKKQAQHSNKNKSEAIDKQFQLYKKSQQKLKYEDTTKAQLRAQLAALKAKRIKLEEKDKDGEWKLKQLSKKLSHCEYESQNLQKKCKQLEAETNKVTTESTNVKQSIQAHLKSNKNQSQDLGKLQEILKQSVNGLFDKHLNKEKLLLEVSELTKQIENAQSSISVLNQEISHQENCHKGLISNLKKSIQSDEQAVKTLTRKAAILNMISNS